MEMESKIVFFGTPRFGAVILEGLAKSKFKPCLLVTKKDRLGNRGKIAIPETKIIAQKHKIKILQKEKKDEIYKELKKISPDIIIVAAYSKILPENIINLPKYGSYNIHPSLLPKYRGPSPVQFAILSGDEKTGVSIFKMNEKMDEGDIIAKKEISIFPQDTSFSLLDKIAALSLSLLLETIPKIISKDVKLEKQDDKKATYSKIIRKEDGKISWDKTAKEIERKIRAFTPWPGVFTFWKKNDKSFLRIKIIESEAIKEENFKEGEVFKSKDKFPAVKCKEGALILKKIQIEGKNPVSGKDFLMGNNDFIKTKL